MSQAVDSTSGSELAVLTAKPRATSLRHRRRAILLLSQLATTVLLLVLWEHVPPAIEVGISTPSHVADALWTWLSTPGLRDDIPATLRVAAVGLGLAYVIAVALAIPLATVRILDDILNPILGVIACIPKLALAPVFILIFGFGSSSKVYFVAASLWFIAFQSLYTALKTVDRQIIANAKILGARTYNLTRDVYAPAMKSAVLTSLRLTAPWAVIATVVAELIASTEGVGYQISIAETNLRPDFVVAGVIMLGVIGLCIDAVLKLILGRSHLG